MTPTPDTTDSELGNVEWVIDNINASAKHEAKAALLAWRDAYTAQRVAEARREELMMADDAIEGDWIEYRDARDAQLSQLEGKEQR